MLICQYLFCPFLLIIYFHQPTHSSKKEGDGKGNLKYGDHCNLIYLSSGCGKILTIFVFISKHSFIYLHRTFAFYWIALFKLLIHFVLYSLSTDRNAELFLFHCKEKTNSKGQCRLTQFKGKLDKIQLIRFLQSQTLPKYVSISKCSGSRDEKKIFDW